MCSWHTTITSVCTSDSFVAQKAVEFHLDPDIQRSYFYLNVVHVFTKNLSHSNPCSLKLFRAKFLKWGDADKKKRTPKKTCPLLLGADFHLVESAATYHCLFRFHLKTPVWPLLPHLNAWELSRRELLALPLIAVWFKTSLCHYALAFKKIKSDKMGSKQNQSESSVYFLSAAETSFSGECVVVTVKTKINCGYPKNVTL